MAPHWLEGNRLTLLFAGTAYFPALLAALDRARQEVHLESYLFADDATGRLIAGALCRAAERGVRVRVLLDGYGAGYIPESLGKAMAAAGVQLLLYRPVVGWRHWRRGRLRRLHRKLVVVDGEEAFVGGINIIDDHDPPGHPHPRFDFAVCVAGPLLGPIASNAQRLWELVAWANFRHRLASADPMLARTMPVGNQRAAFVFRDNLRHRRDIENAYLSAIVRARRQILLAQAYFLPGRRFRRALRDAAARGVEVTLLLQGRADYPWLHRATRAIYGNLLASGVRIFEYQSSYLHAKVGVVDSHWATVGSSNIDPFSLFMAREANVLVEDAGFAAQLGSHLQQAVTLESREIHWTSWKHQPWPLRLINWAAYGLLRLAAGVTGYVKGL